MLILLAQVRPSYAAVFCSKVPAESLFELAAVFNTQPFDKRVYKTGTDDPIYRAVGKVKCGEIAGTGFLLGTCTVISNHHFWRECLKDKVSSQINFEYDHDGNGFSKKQKISFLNGGSSSGKANKERINHPDWAAFRLERCEEKSFPRFSICEDQKSGETIPNLRLAGLSWDRQDQQGISVDESCTAYIGTGEFKNFGHDCASRSKSSGAPLYTVDGKRYCVQAIHAGCYSNATPDKCETGITSKFYEDSTFNFAIPIERFKSALPQDARRSSI